LQRLNGIVVGNARCWSMLHLLLLLLRGAHGCKECRTVFLVVRLLVLASKNKKEGRRGGKGRPVDAFRKLDQALRARGGTKTRLGESCVPVLCVLFAWWGVRQSPGSTCICFSCIAHRSFYFF
jgi:hypothetical protein